MVVAMQIVQIILSITIGVLVLLQAKGAGLGSIFGGWPKALIFTALCGGNILYIPIYWKRGAITLVLPLKAGDQASMKEERVIPPGRIMILLKHF